MVNFSLANQSHIFSKRKTVLFLFFLHYCGKFSHVQKILHNPKFHLALAFLKNNSIILRKHCRSVHIYLCKRIIKEI